MPIQHEHILNPITAVEFYQNGSDQLLVLAGEGSFLKVFEAGSCKLLRQCEVFYGQAIHGIAIQENSTRESDLKIVIWGGQYLVTLQNHEFALFLSGESDSFAARAISGPDWIMDVALSPGNSNHFALVTAHNTVLQARLDSEANTIVLEIPSSPSRSILYSAHLIWDSPSSLLVAAGTVFGEIIVWKCDQAGRSEILHTFTGHEGSIFGVNISVPITFQNNTVGRLLASCSDDRTIRVWKLASEISVATPEGDNLVLRETGFGDNEAGDKSTGYECLATVMGHASRIWGVKFIVENSTERPHNDVSVLSFGEDSTTQHWALEFGLDSPKTSGIPSRGDKSSDSSVARLIQLDTFAFHNGKHIWSSALLSRSQGNLTIVTGGADGKISMYDVVNIRMNASKRSTTGIDDSASQGRPAFWDLEGIKACSPNSPFAEAQIPEAQLPAITGPPVIDPETGKPVKKVKAKKIPKDAFNRYGFLSENQVLMTTTFGRVFLGDIHNQVKWQELFLPEASPHGLKSYALVTGFPELGLAFLAGASGKIYIYQKGDHLNEVADLGCKVADMFKIWDTKSNTFELFVTTLGGQVSTLFSVDLSSPDLVALKKKLEYRLPEKFVVTSAGKIRDILALGSRAGTIALYAKGVSETPVHVWTPASTSTPESITAIIPVPTKNETSKISYILTTDRDGKYSIFSCTVVYSEVDQIITSAALSPIHHGHPPFGPMIETAWFSDVNEDLILYGFKSKNFIAWNNSQQFEISNVDCGGAHRSYAYSPRSAKGGGHFVYTKASQLRIHTQSSESHEIVKSGGHGREIKACAVSSDRGYIATGAEDTEIRLWAYRPGSVSNPESSLRSRAIVQKHTAGIQHLQFHGNYLFSSGGNEEFYIWAIEEIPTFGLCITCEASCPDQTPDRDLRIMGFDVSTFPNSSNTVLISLAFSDSTIRSYAYSKSTGFKLMARGRYTSSCLMQLKHMKIESDEVHLLTAATDGRLVLWKYPLPASGSAVIDAQPVPTEAAQISMISTVKIHQNSIKALDLALSMDEQKIFIVTGGDDNAIGISVYEIANFAATPKTFVLRSAHAAAMTGISFIPTVNTSSVHTKIDERLVFATSSNDQRVKEWEVQVTYGSKEGLSGCNVQINQTGDAFTAVADVGDLVVLSPNNETPTEDETNARSKVLVVGNGLEIWDVSS